MNVAESSPSPDERGDGASGGPGVAAKIPPPGGAAEGRLRLIIESAPVSLIVADPEGKVVAANSAALALIGAERVDELLGKGLEERVATEDAGRVSALIVQVCQGEARSLEYDLVGPDGARRTVETRAVPLRREGAAVAVCLAATWDVTERARSAAALRQVEAMYEWQMAQHAVERQGFDEALKREKTAHHELARDWAREREALEEALAEARGREERVTGLWAAEREALQSTLREAQERERALAAQRLAERDTWQAALEKSERLQTSLAERVANTHQIETALSDLGGRYEELLAQSRGDREEFTRKIEELERRSLQLADDRQAERKELESALEAESLRNQRLLDERAQWHTELEAVSRALKETSARAEHLLDDRQREGPASAKPAAESSWGF